MTHDPLFDKKSDGYETHLFEYDFGGKRWAMQVVARGADEAKLRLQTCATFGRHEGVLKATITAVPSMGWLPRLICWWKNL